MRLRLQSSGRSMNGPLNSKLLIEIHSILFMNNKKSNVNTNSTKLLKGDFLRKIKPDDKFPCFMCFDHPRDKIACKECSGKGWILGSHPMVQFA